MVDEEAYQKHCDALVAQIEKEYPNNTFRYSKFATDLFFKGGFIRHIDVSSRTRVPITPTSTLSELKRVIDKCFEEIKNNYPPDDCPLCMRLSNNKVACSVCVNWTCRECFIKLYETGKGVITCPFCRDTVGEEIHDILMESSIKMLRARFAKVDKW